MIRHYPVMYRNVLEKVQSLKMTRSFKIADCTFGFGGHSHHILNTFPKSLIQGFDIDPQVLHYYQQNYSKELSEECQRRLVVTNKSYVEMQNFKAFDKFDVILADLGFNNFHLQSENRGFSWTKNEPLDMRYHPSHQSCSQFIKTSTELDLRQIFEKYSDLKQSRQVANSIFSQQSQVQTTFDLRDAVVGCFQSQKQRKIAQVFQALRIAVNRQMEDIENLCNLVSELLDGNGAAIFITFHSVERDRIINFIKNTHRKQFSKVHIESPSEQQLQENSMSRSAKMLTFRKNGANR